MKIMLFVLKTTFSSLDSYSIQFLQVVVLHDIPSVLSIAGSGIIFLSIILLTVRKIYNQKARKHKPPEVSQLNNRHEAF